MTWHVDHTTEGWQHPDAGLSRKCYTDGCPGDGRYAPPGRGHTEECAEGVRRLLAAVLAEKPGEQETPIWCSEHMEPYCPRHTSE